MHTPQRYAEEAPTREAVRTASTSRQTLAFNAQCSMLNAQWKPSKTGAFLEH